MKIEIAELIAKLNKELNSITNVDEKIQTINTIKINISSCNPIKEPVDCVVWVKTENVHANDYNPNHVMSSEMKLLNESIETDGFTQPVVVSKDGEEFTVIDGFHRTRVTKENKKVNKRNFGYEPVVILKKNRKERIAATIRHNRARGVHQTQQMSNIVIELLKLGWSDFEICKQLGMDADELLRLKQIIGVDEIYSNEEYGRGWELYDKKEHEK